MQQSRAAARPPLPAAGAPAPDAGSFSRQRTAWRDAVATAALAAVLTTLALTPLAPFARDVLAADLRRHALLGSLIVGYVVWLAARRRLPVPTPLDLPIAGLLVAAAIAIAGSLDLRASLEAVLPLLPAAPLAVVMADTRLLSAAALRRGVTLSAALVAVVALASVWDRWHEWLTLVSAVDGGLTASRLLPPSVPRVDGAGSHPNVVASLLAISLPFAILTVRSGGRAERWLGGAAMVLLGTAMFFTLSRAGWLAALAGGLVTAAGFGAAHGRLRRIARGWAVAGGLTALLCLAALTVIGGARPNWLFRDSLSPRADMRRVGIEVVREHPFSGAGPGMYVPLYHEYGGAYPFAAVHSHNVVVQIAADYGFAGLLAAAALAATVTLLTYRRLRYGDGAARRAGAVAAGAFTAFLVHGMADAPHLFPEILFILLAAVGLLLRSNLVVDRPRQRRSRFAAGPAAAIPSLVLLAFGVALLPLWWRGDRAMAAHESSVRAAVAGRWDDAVAAAERAAGRDPNLAAYHFQVGAARASRYLAASNLEDRDRAVAAYRRGLAIQPRNGAAQVDLAALLLDAGDTAAAGPVIAALGRQAGRDNLLQLAHAVLIQRLGDRDQSIETYAGLLALNPSLALTPFWRDDPFRSAHYVQIIDRSLERAEEVTGPGPAADRLRTTIRVLTGRGAQDGEALRAQLAAQPDDIGLRVSLARLLLAGGEVTESGDLIRAAAARTSDSADVQGALGDWYAATGDLRRAQLAWTAAAFLGDARAGDALGRSFYPDRVPAPVIKLQLQLVEAAWIGRFYLLFQTFRFTFQRHEPAPIIIAGDWLNALPDDVPAWQERLAGWQAAEGPRSPTETAP